MTRTRLTLWAVCFTLLGLQGCAMRMEMGSPPRIDRLTQLVPHVSTKADVLLAMGEPRGYGMARWNAATAPERVWAYEYNVSEGSRVQVTMLLLFFSGDRYDGHFWFGDELNLQQHAPGKK